MSAAGVMAFYQLGAGKVLCGLVKRIAAQSQCFSVATPEDVRAFTLAAH